MLNFDWLADVSTGSAKLVFYVLFILIGILVLLIPKDYVFEGIKFEDRHWWMNLKIWALAVLAVLFYTYLIF